jgi:hypothetical protein
MIVLQGVEAVIAAATKKAAQMSAATRAATAKALHLIERNTKKQLTSSSHQAGTPTPSQPGEPPSLVTGNLRRSIAVTGPDPLGLGRWKGSVGPTAIYGRAQELGNPDRNLPARPFMRPGVEDSLEEVGRIFKTAWDAAVLK